MLFVWRCCLFSILSYISYAKRDNLWWWVNCQCYGRRFNDLTLLLWHQRDTGTVYVATEQHIHLVCRRKWQYQYTFTNKRLLEANLGLTDVLCGKMSASEVKKFMLLLCVSYEYLSREKLYLSGWYHWCIEKRPSYSVAGSFSTKVCRLVTLQEYKIQNSNGMILVWDWYKNVVVNIFCNIYSIWSETNQLHVHSQIEIYLRTVLFFLTFCFKPF